MIDEEYQDLLDSVEDVQVDELEYNGELEELDEGLEHSGIFGMHWGKRRYQNEDGSYTELGKERRRKDYKHMTRAEKKAAKKAKKKAEEARNFKEVKKIAINMGDTKFAEKHYDKFSDDELDKLYQRNYMKTKLSDINAARTQATLDKWVNRLDSVGKLSRSVNTIHESYMDITERGKKAEAEAAKRKMDAKRAKLAYDKEKWEFDQETSDPKAKKKYREEMAELEKQYKKLSNAKTWNESRKIEAEINKIRSEMEISKSKNYRDTQDWREARRKTVDARTTDPYAAKQYLAKRDELKDDYKDAVKKLAKDRGYKGKDFDTFVESRMNSFDKTYPVDYVAYLRSGGSAYTTTKELDALTKGKSKELDELRAELEELKKG